MATHIEALLKDLSFILPQIDVKDIDLNKLMDFDLFDLEGQFHTDLILTSFFSMLEVEVRHLLRKRENALQDLENQLAETARNDMAKPSEARVKEFIQRDSTWKKIRDEVTELEYQVAAVKSVVSDLNRKGISLSVLTARTRAEIEASITHEK